MENDFVIDAGSLGGGISGAGRYAYHLVNELVALETDIPFRVIVPPPHRHSWDINDWGRRENVRIEYADITGLGFKRFLYYARQRPTCVAHHSLSSYVPRFIDCDRTLVTIHDLKDFKLLDSLEGRNKLKQAYVRYLISRSVRAADHVITVSEHTKSDIIDEFGVRSEAISVVPLGPGGGRLDVTGEPPVSPPYLFYLGAVRRHKNVPTLVDAYQRYRRRMTSDLSLVIAGRVHPTQRPALERVIDEEFRDDIHVLGQIDDESAARLYEHATAFVFPSLYEGFGLPPLEAMGYGTPVIASNQSSIPEVVGTAAEYFDPTNPEELVKKITAVVEDEALCARLIRRGYARYDQFSWRRTAEETLEVYRQHLP